MLRIQRRLDSGLEVVKYGGRGRQNGSREEDDHFEGVVAGWNGIIFITDMVYIEFSLMII